MQSSRWIVALICSSLLPAALPGAEDAPALLEKAIQAHGGEAAIARTKRGHLQARVEGNFVGSGEFKATWEETFDLPERYRRVIEGSEGGQAFHREFIVNGNEGWMRLGRASVQAFPVREMVPLEQHWHTALVQLLLLKEKGIQLTMLPEERRDGRVFVGIRSRSPRGEAQLFFDQTTSLLARSRRPMPNPVTGRQAIGETRYDDYRTLQGVRYPMHMKASNADTYSLNINLSSIEFLDKVDPAVFAKPPMEAAPPADGALKEASEKKLEGRVPASDETTPDQWNRRLILATLSVGGFVGAVWWIVHRSRQRASTSS